MALVLFLVSCTLEKTTVTNTKSVGGDGERRSATAARPRDGRGDQRPALTVARGVSPWTCGGKGERRSAAAADISAPRG